MKRRSDQEILVDVRAILESPVGRIGNGGPPICAFEAAMRRTAEKATNGNMIEAKRFIRELQSHGLLSSPQAADDDRFVLRIPKEWDLKAWKAMFEQYGPPPWPGDHDGLIPEERWEANYGPRPVRKRARKW